LIGFSFSRAKLESNVLSLDITKFTQSFAKVCFEGFRVGISQIEGLSERFLFAARKGLQAMTRLQQTKDREKPVAASSPPMLRKQYRTNSPGRPGRANVRFGS
jgi:hypothetical protein